MLSLLAMTLWTMPQEPFSVPLPITIQWQFQKQSLDQARQTHQFCHSRLHLHLHLPIHHPLIATARTSTEVWKKLSTLYASRSRTRAIQLKEEITLIQRGNQPIHEYLHAIKALANEIALIDHPISKDDLTLYVLNGLGPEFREIIAPIWTCKCSLVYEELHDLLVSHEIYLQCLESTT